MMRLLCVLGCGASVLLGSIAGAADSAGAAPIQAVWKPVEIHYSYFGFTTAYNCDGYEAKVERILTALGAPPQTRVQARGCRDLNRPSRDFFVTITTATPVPPAQLPARKESELELLQRLGRKDGLSSQPFVAVWKNLDLSRDRTLGLSPGDCELMEGLVKHVLPKLSVKVIAARVHCTPGQLSIQTPELQVAALVPGDADTAGADHKNRR